MAGVREHRQAAREEAADDLHDREGDREREHDRERTPRGAPMVVRTVRVTVFHTWRIGAAARRPALSGVLSEWTG